MLGKYITRILKPEISPVIGFAAAFTANDLLFDWESFTLPQGGNRLVGATAVIRSNDGTDQVCPMDLFFAKQAINMGDIADGTAPVSMGTQHAAATVNPANAYWDQIVGHSKLTADNFSTAGANEGGFTVGTTGYHASTGATAGLTGQSPLIFEDYGTPSNKGEYTFYVGATAIGTPNFDSNLAFASGTENDLTCDGTDARKILAPGDRIKALDISDNTTIIDIGTVGTVPDATSILLKGTTTSAGTLGDGDLIFNINPIKLILTFER
tara:strand:+ start:1173 stop:1976 length:804 start_codon:yes stop_codon:yes gene_type:complete